MTDETRAPGADEEAAPRSSERGQSPDSRPWAEIVLELEACGDPREGPRTLSYGELVARVLSLERELAALRARLDEGPTERSSLSLTPTRPKGTAARSAGVGET